MNPTSTHMLPARGPACAACLTVLSTRTRPGVRAGKDAGGGTHRPAASQLASASSVSIMLRSTRGREGGLRRYHGKNRSLLAMLTVAWSNPAGHAS